MTDRVFVDSSFYIALLNRRDTLHARAATIAVDLDARFVRLVTTHAVIFEVLAHFSRGGPESRRQASEFVKRLRKSRAIEIIAISAELLDAAVDLYGNRLDKRYSLADCVGMVVAGEREITEVLSTDRDFEAEGFTILLRA